MPLPCFNGTALARALLLVVALSFGTEGAMTQAVAAEAESREGRGPLVLHERWRIGGEDDEENLLGVIGRAFSDDDGRVYLVDLQLSQVHVYDAEGEYLESLGDQGEGPGEVRRLQDALLLPEGSLGLVQAFPGQIVKVHLDGNPAGLILPGRDDPTAGGFHGLRRVRYRGGQLVISGVHSSRDESVMTRQNYLGAFSLEGQQQVLYQEQTTEQQLQRREVDEAANDFPHQRWALGPDGRVYLAPERNRYLIEVYLPDGDLERSISRGYESRRRSAVEMERTRAIMQPRRRRRGGEIQLTIAETAPDIAALHVNSAGELWVLSSRGYHDQAEGVLMTYDVFAPDGVFLRQLAVMVDGQWPADGFIDLDDGRYLLLRGLDGAWRAMTGSGNEESESGDEAMPLEVICFEAVH